MTIAQRPGGENGSILLKRFYTISGKILQSSVRIHGGLFYDPPQISKSTDVQFLYTMMYNSRLCMSMGSISTDTEGQVYLKLDGDRLTINTLKPKSRQ